MTLKKEEAAILKKSGSNISKSEEAVQHKRGSNTYKKEAVSCKIKRLSEISYSGSTTNQKRGSTNLKFNTSLGVIIFNILTSSLLTAFGHFGVDKQSEQPLQLYRFLI